MKKILLILVLSLLAIAISFNVFVDRAQALTTGSLPVYQEEDWERKYRELEAKYAALNATFYKLVNDIVPKVEALQSDYEKTKSELEKTKSDYEKTKSELETSRGDYRALDIKYKSAVRDLNTRTTLMYAFIVTTVIFVATTLYLALRKPKART